MLKQLGALWRRKTKYLDRVGIKRKREGRKPLKNQALVYFHQASVHWIKIICGDLSQQQMADEENILILGLSALGITRWDQLMQQDVEILHVNIVSNEAESTQNINVPGASQNWVTKSDCVGH